MSWLDRFSSDRRRVEALLEQHRFREAVAELQPLEGEDARLYAAEVCQRAALHWLREAERACNAHDRGRMNRALAEAARYYRDDLGAVFRETRRRIRARILELTIAAHWVVLLQAASDQRAALFAKPTSRPPPSYEGFRNPKLLRQIGRRLGETLDSEGIERISLADLQQLRTEIESAFPDELRPEVRTAHPEWVRAALHVANSRPDLAVVPLLELPATDPLVCLERARVSHALGYPATAMLALADFRTNFGRHVTVRRLHTGVFMAQMAVQCGDAQRAVEILEEVPLERVGRRPVLLYAQLLGIVGRIDDARATLEGWIREHPDDREAERLLGRVDNPPLGADAALLTAPGD